MVRMVKANANSMLVNYLVQALNASWMRNNGELKPTPSSASNFPKTGAQQSTWKSITLEWWQQQNTASQSYFKCIYLNNLITVIMQTEVKEKWLQIEHPTS